MTLVPSGKARKMVGQSYGSPLTEGYGLKDISAQGAGPVQFDTDAAMDEEVSPHVPTGDAPTANGDPHAQTDKTLAPPSDVPTETDGASQEKSKTLSSYIFGKLESYGYPGRRLQEFKSKFVHESVSPDGVKDIQVEIPDKKYPGPTGTADTIENEDLKEIVSEINQAFGLNFNGAERSDGKWTIKFTSETISNDEDEMVHDNLDEVYGKPSGNKKQMGAHKAACPSLPEMIKSAKTAVVKTLSKGDSNDPENVRSA